MPHRTTENARVRADARDRGLRRVRTATGWITVASAAGAVVLAGGYAQALPGKTTGSSKPSSTIEHTGAPGTGTPTTAATTAPTSAAASTHAAATTAATTAQTSARATSAPATSSAPAPVLQAPTQAPTTAAPTTAQATSGGS